MIIYFLYFLKVFIKYHQKIT